MRTNPGYATLCTLVLAACGGSATPGPASDPGFHLQGSDGFPATAQGCLDQIAGFGGYGKQLLDSLASGSVTIIEAQGTSSATASTQEGEPATIEWSTQGGTYGCSGAPKVPCATLIHELAHAQENISGTPLAPGAPNGEDEWGGVKAENWLLAQLGLCQRACYDADSGDIAFPQESNVLWPLPSGMQQVSALAGGEVLCAVEPTMLTLTIDNQSPDQILVEGGNDKQLICGGTNPAFRESSTTRNCTLTFLYNPSNNPYAVPLTTLVAYLAGSGKPQWTNESNAPESCGGNAFSEYCQIAMGENGSTSSPLSLAKPASRTVHVKYVP